MRRGGEKRKGGEEKMRRGEKERRRGGEDVIYSKILAYEPSHILRTVCAS